jgi:hypothetical protein
MEKISDARLRRLSRSPYSPDLSPCDFWLFGMMKEKMKNCELETVEDILRAVTDIWEDLTFIDVQCVFFNLMNCLQWVIEQEGDYSINRHLNII